MPSGRYGAIMFNDNINGEIFTMQGTQLTIGEDYNDSIAIILQKLALNDLLASQEYLNRLGSLFYIMYP
jgi:hypothetical protein